MKHLLVADLTKRYGNLKGGVEDIKKHRWYKTMDWKMLYEKKITPSYKPEVKYIVVSILEEKMIAVVSALIQTP